MLVRLVHSVRRRRRFRTLHAKGWSRSHVAKRWIMGTGNYIYQMQGPARETEGADTAASNKVSANKPLPPSPSSPSSPSSPASPVTSTSDQGSSMAATWSETKKAKAQWDKVEKQREFMEHLGKLLGYSLETPNDWYALKKSQLLKAQGGGASLLLRYGNSPQKLLRAVFPEHAWLPWLFQKVPQRFWNDKKNQRAFLTWLAEEKWHFMKLEQWYEVRTSEVVRAGGGGLLLQYRGSLRDALTTLFPAHPWKPWAFAQLPRNYWDESQHRRCFLEDLRAELHLSSSRLTDWYAVTPDAVVSHGGEGLLRYFGGSLAAALRDAYPLHKWHPWCFAAVPPRYWQHRSHVLEFLEWLREQLEVQSMEEWYSVQRTDVERLGGKSLLDSSRLSLPQLLQAHYTLHRWLPWKFAETPAEVWDSNDTVRQFFYELGCQRSFTRPEDWYQLTIHDIRAAGGERMLSQRFHGSLVSALALAYPLHQWDTWLFQVQPAPSAPIPSSFSQAPSGELTGNR